MPFTQTDVVTIDGATGYLGNHLVNHLLKRGLKVRALVHAGAKNDDIGFLNSLGAQVFQSDLDPGSIKAQEALSGAACLVHLIGSIAPKKGESLIDLHAGQMEKLLKACRAEKPKIILVTALGTAEDAESLYHRSKWQSEECLRRSGLPYFILRPSLIVGRSVGRRNSKLISRFMQLIDSRKKVPLVGGGKNLLQPVFVDDLCRCIANVVETDALCQQTVEIGGEDIVSMKELVERLMELQGKEKPLQTIPAPLAFAIANVLQAFQTVPLLSVDQVKLSLKDNVCSSNQIESILKTKATGLCEALSTYNSESERTKSVLQLDRS